MKRNPANQELYTTAGKQKATLPKSAEEEFLKSLTEQQREELKNRRQLTGVNVRVRVEGNKHTLLGLA